jgi:hypothetical protein
MTLAIVTIFVVNSNQTESFTFQETWNIAIHSMTSIMTGSQRRNTLCATRRTICLSWVLTNVASLLFLLVLLQRMTKLQ